jgi:putative colanic acid biosynthesis UDP-glucose lipid carrier transferase
MELVAAVPVCGEEDFEGKLVRLREATVDAGIDEVVLCLPLADAGRVRRAVDLLLAVPAEVSLFADRAGLELAEHGLATAGRFPRMRLLERPVRDWGRIAKGLMDRVGAAVLLVLLSPLFAVIALAIRLDSPGPVFYRQLRRGLGGRPFEMLKFRSMYADRCDAPDAPIRQARRDDPRFTRVGRFLRRTSLDELPQLWNVLRGEMSLVGPRPHPIRMDDSYAEEIALYLGRHRLKPGITGWAQIHGFRGETPTLEAIRARIDHDLYYIRNWSLGLDLWILLLTPWKLLTCRNAY